MVLSSFDPACLSLSLIRTAMVTSSFDLIKSKITLPLIAMVISSVDLILLSLLLAYMVLSSFEWLCLPLAAVVISSTDCWSCLPFTVSEVTEVQTLTFGNGFVLDLCLLLIPETQGNRCWHHFLCL